MYVRCAWWKQWGPMSQINTDFSRWKERIIRVLKQMYGQSNGSCKPLIGMRDSQMVSDAYLPQNINLRIWNTNSTLCNKLVEIIKASDCSE